MKRIFSFGLFLVATMLLSNSVCYASDAPTKSKATSFEPPGNYDFSVSLYITSDNYVVDMLSYEVANVYTDSNGYTFYQDGIYVDPGIFYRLKKAKFPEPVIRLWLTPVLRRQHRIQHRD